MLSRSYLKRTAGIKFGKTKKLGELDRYDLLLLTRLFFRLDNNHGNSL